MGCKRTGSEKACANCGAFFYVEAARQGAKFCSMGCLWAGRKKRYVAASVARICEQCGKSYSVRPYRKEKTRFCSFRCVAGAMRAVRDAAMLDAVRASSPDKKTCLGCGQEKPHSEFYKRKNSPDGLRHSCRACHKVKCEKWTVNNPGKKAERDRSYHAANRETQNAKSAQRYRDNIEMGRAARKKWHAENIDKVRARNKRKRQLNSEKYRADRRQHYRDNKAQYVAAARKREKHILRATPAWADLKKIEAFYIESDRLSRETGIKHHVDHIYPLRGKTSSGLHVESNLQILSALENLQKGNKVIDQQTELGCIST